MQSQTHNQEEKRNPGQEKVEETRQNNNRVKNGIASSIPIFPHPSASFVQKGALLFVPFPTSSVLLSLTLAAQHHHQSLSLVPPGTILEDHLITLVNSALTELVSHYEQTDWQNNDSVNE
jgi:hypothetical protein